MAALLTLENVTVKAGSVALLEKISFTVQKGQTLGLVGESGSGKSMTALTILRLLPENVQLTKGKIVFEEKDLTDLKENEMRALRGRKLAMIFQNPQAAFNPIRTIGAQMDEAIRAHFAENKKQRLQRARHYLNEAELTKPDSILSAYPFQLSGGMLQRALIAMALSLQPDILIADEPTTALDVVIQAQIIALLRKIQQKNQMTMIMISHNLGLVAQLAHHILVLYGGRMAEYGSTEQILRNAKHPYTRALLKARPSLKSKQSVLEAIPGSPPPAGAFADRCKFEPRCPQKMKICAQKVPALTKTDGAQVACFLYGDKAYE